MKMRSLGGWVVAVLALMAMVPAAASAQSAIAGIVKDTTGAVMPGVTVEAASDVLIEKVKSAVTDSGGQYRIVDLRPGTYSMTFTLPGFNTVKRDGLELPANFTATVSVDMRVGTVEETVTVSGQTPVVDVQNALAQNVMSRQLLDSIPTGRNYQAVAATTPSILVTKPDVGGSQGMFYTDLQVHGSDRRDQAIQLDGMSTVDGEGQGNVVGMYRDDGDNEEIVYQTSAIPAEVSQGGVRINMIGREGGNAFKGAFLFAETPGGLQSDNFTDELKAKGLSSGTTMKRIYDYNFSGGGPIVRDKLWFFSSTRYWGVDRLPANTFYPANYPVRAGERAVDDALHYNISTRLTSQITPRNKLMAFYAWQPIRTLYHRGVGSGISPEASRIQSTANLYSAQAKWTSTVSSRILIESGFSTTFLHWLLRPQGDPTGRKDEPLTCCAPGQVTHSDLTQQATTVTYGNFFDGRRFRRNYVGSISYVTGSHALKTGIQYGEVFQGDYNNRPAGLIQEYRNGVPTSVQVTNSPTDQRLRTNPDLGIFLQDTWTLGRLTLSPGVRFEYFNGSIQAQDVGAGPFVPARHFDAIKNVPNWKNTMPRFGVVYDLFGNAKTALKASVSKYMQGESVSFAALYNPMVSSTDRRTWSDLNKDDIAQPNEIGPSNNNRFGIAQTRAPEAGIKRPYHVEYTISIQHELMSGVSLNGGFYRRKYYDLFYTENLLAPFSAYTPVSVANPLGGDPITVYNLDPTKRGLVDLVDRTSPNNTHLYNGFDLGFNARLQGGVVLFGGMSTGKDYLQTCDVQDPNQLRYCDQADYIPYLTQLKLAASYKLPWEIQASGTYQSYPGYPTSTGESGGLTQAGLAVNYLVTPAIVPGLTQPQVSVNLIAPGSKYLERRHQIDFRFGKTVRAGKMRLTGSFDVFNALNASTVLSEVETFGTALGRPLEILQGRLFRFSVQASF